MAATLNISQTNTSQVNNSNDKEFNFRYQDIHFTAGCTSVGTDFKLEISLPHDFSIRFDSEKLQHYEEELEDLAIEQKWDEMFAASQDLLMEWANEARADREAGRTIPLYRDDE